MMQASNNNGSGRGFLPALYRAFRVPSVGRGDRSLPAAAEPEAQNALVDRKTVFESRAEVEQFLPDILGRALARAWIDQTFRVKFLSDPKETLQQYGVFLPSTITIEIQTQGVSRPRVIVYEQKTPKSAKLRVVYLQLVMKAGR